MSKGKSRRASKPFGSSGYQNATQSAKNEEKEIKDRLAELATREEAFKALKEEVEERETKVASRESAVEDRQTSLDEREQSLNKQERVLQKTRDAIEKEREELNDQEAFIQGRVKEAQDRAVEEIRQQEQEIRNKVDAEREAKWKETYDTLMQKQDDDLRAAREKVEAETQAHRDEVEADCQEQYEKTAQECSDLRKKTDDDCANQLKEAKDACEAMRKEAQDWCDAQREETEQACESRRSEVRDACETLRKNAQQDRDRAQEMLDAAYREAEETRANAKEEARTQQEERQAAYLQQQKDITARETKLQEDRDALEMDRMTLEAEQECVKELQENFRARKEQFSPAVVEKLQESLSLTTAKLDSLREENKKQAERIELLSRYQRDESGASTEDLLKRIDTLEHENDELGDQLAGYPSEKEIDELREKARTLESLTEELRQERARRITAESALEQNKLDVREVGNQAALVASYSAMNDQLLAAIDRNTALYKQNVMAKFQGLLAIDHEVAQENEYHGQKSGKSLADLVDYVRAYGAARGDGHTRLYYTQAAIRTFIASMAASHLIILQGLSGTGKSSLPRLFEKALHFSNDLIPVQASWNDNRELLGYDNDFTKKFKETDFTKAVYRASLPKNAQRVALVILDEMNLARIEYYFADFLAVMEKTPDDWYVSLVNSNEDDDKPAGLRGGTQLRVTPNIWFIGTANRDESTMGITDKVYDRAQVMTFDRRADAFEASCTDALDMSFDEFDGLLENAASDPALRMTSKDWEDIDTLDAEMKETLDITFGNRIRNQMERFIPVYRACGGTKEQAIDYMICHKVLRKLEERFEPYIVPGLKKVKGDIADFYGESNMVSSLAYLDKIIKRLSAGSEE